jgi:hypothetical protein
LVFPRAQDKIRKNFSLDQENLKDGYIHLGSGGGTGVMRADDIITFTIKWNGKEETLALSVKR